MSEIKPYNYNNLDEIILFKGKENSNVINLSREGKYINLIKENEKNKRYFRYDLQEKKFQRINFYKTTDDKITDVRVKNITGWFKDEKIVTKDLHFGRLIIFAKFNNKFSRYISPVRFIQQLGDKMIMAIEQWESLGFKVLEMEEFFGHHLVGDNYDLRKDVYLGEEYFDFGSWRRRINYYGGISLSPSDFSKELLNYIKKTYKRVDSNFLNKMHSDYNRGEYHIEKKLKKLGKDPEFVGIFHYTSQQYGASKEKWAFGTSRESRVIRAHMIETIQDFNLELKPFCSWLKKQQNVDRNGLDYLFGYGNHYSDYLKCEYDLCDGKLSKMNKYPDNFRTHFHRIQQEYAIKKKVIDKSKFEKQAEKYQKLEHIGKKYQILIPKRPEEIHHEAQCLHHCVRTYIPRVVEGKTLILFLRNKKELDKPLITLEVKNNTLTQAYGEHDSKPQKEHLEFLRMWCKMKKLDIGCWKTDLQWG